MSKSEIKPPANDLATLRKSFEEAQLGLKMAVFEAVRAPTINRYKLEEAFKKWFDKHQQIMGKICDRIEEMSKPTP